MPLSAGDRHARRNRKITKLGLIIRTAAASAVRCSDLRAWLSRCTDWTANAWCFRSDTALLAAPGPARAEPPWEGCLGCAFPRLPAKVTGCIAGAVLANLMFGQSAVSISVQDRASGAHFLSEIPGDTGSDAGDLRAGRSGRARSAPAAVGAYIGAAYFFTSSASFANPAITIGRMFSDTFARSAPASAPPGSHRITMRVTGDRNTRRLLGLQLFGHRAGAG